MSTTIQIERFDPKTASREQWDIYHRYRRSRAEESDRLDDYFPDHEFELMAKHPDPFGEHFSFVVPSDGGFISAMGYYIANPTSPGYESNKHLLNASIGVLTPHRRHGIATTLLRMVYDVMTEHSKTVLTFWTEEDDGHAFLKRIGAEVKQEAAENRLKLAEVDRQMVSDWVKQGRERNPETELIFFENRIPADRFDEVAPVLSELLNTIPFDELDHGDIVITPEMMKEWYDRMDQLGADHHTLITREKDGTISGMTDVEFSPQLADRVGQNFTGVHPDHRGRGLGKWLKAAMLEYIFNRYPDAIWIVTGNANSNDPMLGINKKLGFKKHRSETAYQISYEGLGKYLASV